MKSLFEFINLFYNVEIVLFFRYRPDLYLYCHSDLESAVSQTSNTSTTKTNSHQLALELPVRNSPLGICVVSSVRRRPRHSLPVLTPLHVATLDHGGFDSSTLF